MLTAISAGVLLPNLSPSGQPIRATNASSTPSARSSRRRIAAFELTSEHADKGHVRIRMGERPQHRHVRCVAHRHHDDEGATWNVTDPIRKIFD